MLGRDCQGVQLYCHNIGQTCGTRLCLSSSSSILCPFMCPVSLVAGPLQNYLVYLFSLWSGGGWKYHIRLPLSTSCSKWPFSDMGRQNLTKNGPRFKYHCALRWPGLVTWTRHRFVVIDGLIGTVIHDTDYAMWPGLILTIWEVIAIGHHSIVNHLYNCLNTFTIRSFHLFLAKLLF